jgi:hypothetical protein
MGFWNNFLLPTTNVLFRCFPNSGLSA